jgi:hypothetical protein
LPQLGSKTALNIQKQQLLVSFAHSKVAKSQSFWRETAGKTPKFML